MRLRTSLVLLLSLAMLMQPMWVQAAPAGSPAAAVAPSNLAPATPDYTKGAIWWPNFSKVFRTPYVAEANLADSDRLEQLLREGNIYLSLDDSIALALENNLDIAVARYGPLIADADILRARAGAFLRGPGIGGVSSQSTGSSAGGGGAPGPQPVVNTVSVGGPAIPQFDPVLTGTAVNWNHNSSAQTNTIVTGTNTLINEGLSSGISYSQAFDTGTAFSLGWNNQTNTSNAIRNVFNPYLQSSFVLNFQQNLLQGFGRSINRRNMRIARNNREISDLAFEEQVIQTVAQVEDLYWDLVSFIENVRVQQQAVETSQKLYNDNKRQVEIGTLAPIEIVRAEAQLASDEQNLTVAQTQVQQQETILKNALSKSGVANPSIAQAHVVPTTQFVVPQSEAVEPIQDLMSYALRSRPELAQSRISMTNSDISLKATQNALRPSLNFVASMTNNALAGQINPNFVNFGGSTLAAAPSEFFVGGLGTSLKQLFSRNFPSYGVGLQLNVPVRNRSAQADMITAQLQLRQAEIRVHQTENSVRVEVQNALINVQQARARLDAATKARILQEQTLDAEQKKYALGADTIYNVILSQRDLTSARSTEVAAINNYAKAKIELERATGQTLDKNNIKIDEAYNGAVSKPPDPLPARTPAPPKP
ncbi:MAG TPA: TolC family protein [Bryobacterales bacterium]|nr:TolC family protein [Bryobacterales bacterium]